MRKPLSNKQRFEIFKRDGFTCQYCGANGQGVQLQIDHIEPVSKGGKCEEGNFLTACRQCNSGKAANAVLPGLKEGPENILRQMFNPNRCFSCSEMTDDASYNEMIVYLVPGPHISLVDKYDYLLAICIKCLDTAKSEGLHRGLRTLSDTNDYLLQKIEAYQKQFGEYDG